METFDNFYKTICRVCLSHSNGENMVSLIDKSSDSELSCFGKAVITFANIHINNDSLPDSMCRDCLCLLKQAIVFKKKCEINNELLSNFVTQCSESEIKEKVSQFVMFKHYFPQGYSVETSGIKDNGITVTTVDIASVNTAHIAESSLATITPDIESSYENDDDFNDLFQDDDDENMLEKSENKSEDPDELLKELEKVIHLNSKPINRYYKKTVKTLNYSQRRNLRSQQLKTFIKDSTSKVRIKRSATRNITCKICNKVLANMNTYKCHMQRHNGFRYVCEHCAKGFPIYAQLQYHQAAVHDIGRNYMCKQCDFRGARKWDLVVHERIHTGERPYACDKCGLTFHRRFVWKKHAIYHSEKTVQCPQCPRKFYRRSEMLSHANNVHERVYVFACHECDVTYMKPSTVRRHLVEKHGIAREVQGRVRRIELGNSSFRNDCR